MAGCKFLKGLLVTEEVDLYTITGAEMERVCECVGLGKNFLPLRAM